MDGALRPLPLEDLETLLAALDPRLEGFGAGPSCLDDARAFLARLASGASTGGEEGSTTTIAAMEEWIETWRAAGGNRQTLRILVQTLMAERLERALPEGEEGNGPTTPDAATGTQTGGRQA
jgi:hypothetical protein